jgi:hypothetical protein
MDINLLKGTFLKNSRIFSEHFVNIFHEGKGHFATRKRALFVSSENWGGGIAPSPLVLTPLQRMTPNSYFISKSGSWI